MRRFDVTWGARGLAGLLALVVTAGSTGYGAERPGDAGVRARARLYEPAILAAASRHGIDPRLLWTIAYLETRFRPNLTSPAGAGGLCQLMPATAARFGVANRYDPVASLEGAAEYLRFLSRTFGGRLDLVLAGYNAGEGAVLAYRDGKCLRLPSGKVINRRGIRTGGIPPYCETRDYVASGQLVFEGIDRARVFALPCLEPVNRVVGASDLVPDPTPTNRATRTIYLMDGGQPPPRALELPDEREIARVFVNSPRSTGAQAAEPPRVSAATQSIRFE